MGSEEREQEREVNEQQAEDGQPRPTPRKKIESPQEFYKQITAREDVRRLLQKLAKL